MMVSHDGAFGILMGAAVGTLFLVPAHGSAQDSLSSFGGPPDGWEKAIAKLARERAGEFVKLAEELEKS